MEIIHESFHWGQAKKCRKQAHTCTCTSTHSHSQRERERIADAHTCTSTHTHTQRIADKWNHWQAQDLMPSIQIDSIMKQTVRSRIHIGICLLSSCSFWNLHGANPLNFPLFICTQISFPLNLPFFCTSTTTTFCRASCPSESSRLWMQNIFSFITVTSYE